MLAQSPPAPEAIFPAAGYQAPQYTQIPDLLLDYQMAHMSGAELKVALYICRRTFGFKKNVDPISFNQMLEGIVTQDGRRLDFGTGLSRDSLARAIKSLEEKRVILVLRGEDEKGSKQTNLYALNIGQSFGPTTQEPQTPMPKPTPPPAPTAPPPSAPRGQTPQNPPAEGSPKIGLGGSTIFGLGGSTENGLGGSTIFGLTINSSNNKQLNNKQNNNNNTEPARAEGPDDASATDVVVALQSVGLSARVAKQLAAHYPEARIREKLAFLSFLAEKNAVSHPAGWLRSAIVEDYARPDGFMTAEAAGEAQGPLFAYQVETPPPADPAPPVRATARAYQLARLRQVYRVGDDARAFGDELMGQLQNSASKGSLLHALLPELEFLRYADHAALFAVESPAALKQIQHPGTQTAIRRALRFLLREAEPQLKLEEIRLDFCLLAEGGETGPDQPEEVPVQAAMLDGEQPPVKRKARRR